MNPNKNIIENPHFKENPFVVPEDYFDNNFIKLYENIFSSDEPIWQVPEDYFDTQKIKLYQKVLTQNQYSEFSVPNNYFDNNQKQIIQKILPLKKVNQFNKKIIRIIQYSVSAAVVISVVWGIDVLVDGQEKVSTQNDCQTIACLTKNEILLQDNTLDDEVIEESIDEQKISEYFGNSDKVPSISDSNQINELNETF